MKFVALLAALALALALLLPAPPAAAWSPSAGPDGVGLNDFAFDLYGALAKGEKGNLFLSPFSVSTALGMAAAGAKGETLACMEKSLRAKARGRAMQDAYGELVGKLNEKGKAGAFELAVADRLFGQKGKAFLPEYVALLDAVYGAGGIHPLDFKADAAGSARFINDWVAKVTKDKIKDLIPPGVITAVTRLVLVNAIYFKGSWADAFDKAATKDEPFAGDDGAKSTVPLMHRTAEYACAESGGAKAVELPYRKGELSMVAILPPEGTKLADFEKELTWERLKPLVAALAPRETVLALPRFKMEWKGLLAETLKALGMGLPCSAGADFSGIDGEKWLFIGEVIHQAFVDVNEEGTEAAAATAVSCPGGAAPGPASPPFVFRADRPFLFYIRDNASGAILFLGRVAKP